MEGGGGGGHPDPEIRGAAGPLDPSPGSVTANKRNGQNCSSSQALMGAEASFASLREERKRTLCASLNPVKPLKSPMPKILD